MKRMPVSYMLLSVLLLITSSIYCQPLTQTLRGIVLDKTSEKPLSGVSVTIMGTSIGTTTDEEGRFLIEQAPVGRQMLSVTCNGYKPVLMPEILVTTGKEVLLEIAMEQRMTDLEEVTVAASRTRKGNATNEYVTGSNRSFTIDEVTRYAGGRNDPSRLVSNFAGVVANNDSRNDIVVRGNSPAGVLWRIEGLPSPSPNHYAALGTTGGPVSALNTNALKTSDFLTGAFPAEFGNATAAVFDINLRTGNAARHERTLQVNLFSGLEAMLEGPLSKKKDGSSYLLGYRYSFAQIGASLGLNIGTSAAPNYQDWVYNINFAKTKWGRFSLYGMGGISKIDFIGEDTDTTDFYARKDQDSYSDGNFSIFGAKHTLDLGKKSFIRTAVSYSSVKNDFDVYQYPLPFTDYNNRYQVTSSRNQQNSLRVSSFVNTKVNAAFSWRAGISLEQIGLNTLVNDKEGMQAQDPFKLVRDFDGDFRLIQYFAQLKYKPDEKITLNAGVHATQLDFNSTGTIEPRASASYQLTSSDMVYASFGMHSQIQPFPVYLYEGINQDGTKNLANRDLDLTKAIHYVIGYEKRFLANWRLKLEGYYQDLYDVPVESFASGFSLLNSGSDFTFPEKAGLVNEGTGSNLGLEITLERFLNKGYYFMLTGSLFDSKYKGSDGVERNTSFNYGTVANVLVGKEWKSGRTGKNAFTVDIKLSSIGGRYTTPIDLAASIASNKEVLDESSYNSEQLNAYFRLDTKFGYRINSTKRRISQTIYIDLQNVTGRENIFLQRYNPERRTIGALNQIGFFPDLLYKINF